MEQASMALMNDTAWGKGRYSFVEKITICQPGASTV